MSVLAGLGAGLGFAGDMVNSIWGGINAQNNLKFQKEAFNKNFQFQQDAYNQNFAFQKENYNYQKQLQREAWNREDNAVSRRARDLEASGMSKTLAAGNGAQSSSPISLTAPQKQAAQTQAPQGQSPNISFNGAAQGAQMAMSLIRDKKQIDMTEAEIDYIKLQGLRVLKDIEVSDVGMSHTKADTSLKQQDYAYRQYLNDWYRSKGMVPGNSTMFHDAGATAQQIFNVGTTKPLESAVTDLIGKVKNSIDGSGDMNYYNKLAVEYTKQYGSGKLNSYMRGILGDKYDSWKKQYKASYK